MTVEYKIKTRQYLVMNQHLLVIFVYVHQRYNTYWYVETDFFLCIRQIEERIHVIFFCLFLIVSPPHIRSAFTTKLQQLYKEGRPRKVRSGKHVVGRSETGYPLCLEVPSKRHTSVEKDKLDDILALCWNTVTVNFTLISIILLSRFQSVCACIKFPL